MTSQIQIDVTAIMQMAFVACLVAGLVPIGRYAATKGDWRSECRSGMIRAACGILAAVGSWSTIQVVGGAIDGPRQVAQTVQVPLVVMPHGMGPAMPRIDRGGNDI